MKPLEQKRQEAEERNTRWASLSPEQQLAELNRRRLTASKQRARIIKRLEEERNAQKGTKRNGNKNG